MRLLCKPSISIVYSIDLCSRLPEQRVLLVFVSVWRGSATLTHIPRVDDLITIGVFDYARTTHFTTRHTAQSVSPLRCPPAVCTRARSAVLRIIHTAYSIQLHTDARGSLFPSFRFRTRVLFGLWCVHVSGAYLHVGSTMLYEYVYRNTHAFQVHIIGIVSFARESTRSYRKREQSGTQHIRADTNTQMHTKIASATMQI